MTKLINDKIYEIRYKYGLESTRIWKNINIYVDLITFIS